MKVKLLRMAIYGNAAADLKSDAPFFLLLLWSLLTSSLSGPTGCKLSSAKGDKIVNPVLKMNAQLRHFTILRKTFIFKLRYFVLYFQISRRCWSLYWISLWNPNRGWSLRSNCHMPPSRSVQETQRRWSLLVRNFWRTSEIFTWYVFFFHFCVYTKYWTLQ